MTSLHGDFDCDLPIEAAVNACGEAFNRLGWRFEQPAANRVVAHPSGFDGHPPRIEAVLRASAEGSDIEIIGQDSPENRLDDLQLMVVLDKARDAIQDTIVRLDFSPAIAPANLAATPVDAPAPKSGDAEADTGQEPQDSERRRPESSLRPFGAS
jgi:hypothetical protein